MSTSSKSKLKLYEYLLNDFSGTFNVKIRFKGWLIKKIYQNRIEDFLTKLSNYNVEYEEEEDNDVVDDDDEVINYDVNSNDNDDHNDNNNQEHNNNNKAGNDELGKVKFQVLILIINIRF